MRRFKNILCAVDPDAGRRAAVERAVTLAENNQANLTLVGVADPALAERLRPDLIVMGTVARTGVPGSSWATRRRRFSTASIAGSSPPSRLAS